jgi:hypothetical protein
LIQKEIYIIDSLKSVGSFGTVAAQLISKWQSSRRFWSAEQQVVTKQPTVSVPILRYVHAMDIKD